MQVSIVGELSLEEKRASADTHAGLRELLARVLQIGRGGSSLDRRPVAHSVQNEDSCLTLRPDPACVSSSSHGLPLHLESRRRQPLYGPSPIRIHMSLAVPTQFYNSRKSHRDGHSSAS